METPTTENSVTTDLTKCPICLDTCVNPRSLPCLHWFCYSCLQSVFKLKRPGADATCPVCRKHFQIPPSGLAGLQHHFIVQQLIDLNSLRENVCDKHPHKQVELYCNDCTEDICVLCFAANHRDHDNSEIREAADSFRPRIDDDDKKVLSAFISVREQSDQTKRDVTEFLGRAEDVKKTIRATVDAVKRSIDSQANGVLAKLESVTSESSIQAQGVQDKYQLASVTLESFHTRSRELLDKGRPSDITRSARELHDRATELLDNDVTAVKYRPPHVTFTPADVTLVNRLSLIGKLTVTAEEQPEEPSAKVIRVDTDQDEDDEQLKRATSTAAELQDKLTQAAGDRERQLQMELDKMKDDASHLQTFLEQRPNSQKEFDDFRREHEMKQCESRMWSC